MPICWGTCLGGRRVHSSATVSGRGAIVIVFRNCTIVDSTSTEAREGHDVLVENERIREISDTRIEVHGAWEVAVDGRTLMPGLIDAHAHVVLGNYNLRRLEDIPPTLMTAQAAQVMRGMLDRGFTSIRDAGGADWGLAKAVEDGLLAGPRLFISGRALSQTGGHGDFRPRTQDTVEPCGFAHPVHFASRIVDGPEAVVSATRDELRRGASQIKVMASGGNRVSQRSSQADPILAGGAQCDRGRGGGLGHLCDGSRLHRGSRGSCRLVRRSLHRARQSDRSRGGGPHGGRGCLSRADTRDLRSDETPRRRVGFGRRQSPQAQDRPGGRLRFHRTRRGRGRAHRVSAAISSGHCTTCSRWSWPFAARS